MSPSRVRPSPAPPRVASPLEASPPAWTNAVRRTPAGGLTSGSLRLGDPGREIGADAPGVDTRLPAPCTQAQQRQPVRRLGCRLRVRARRTDVLHPVERVGDLPEPGVLRRPLVGDEMARQRLPVGSVAVDEALPAEARVALPLPLG